MFNVFSRWNSNLLNSLDLIQQLALVLVRHGKYVIHEEHCKWNHWWTCWDIHVNLSLKLLIGRLCFAVNRRKYRRNGIVSKILRIFLDWRSEWKLIEFKMFRWCSALTRTYEARKHRVKYVHSVKQLFRCFKFYFPFKKKVWLPPNITWKDIEPGSSETIEYADHRHLLWPIPISFVIIVIRFTVERWEQWPNEKSINNLQGEWISESSFY